MPREVYFNFVVYMDNEGEIDETALDTLLEQFMNAADATGLHVAGGTMSADELDDAEIEDGDDVCDKCGGLGYLDPEDTVEALSEEDWDDLYGNQAPIAQRTEQPSPTRQVEGSNPSRSANVREHRQDNREAGRQDSESDSERDRERREDPGRDHSGEDG